MKQKRKIIAAFMAAAMILQAAPLTANADSEWSKYDNGVTTLGTSGISAPKAPENDEDAWTGSYVYYGYGEDSHLKFRVLDPNTSVFGGTTMFLDCDTTLSLLNPFRMDSNASDANIWAASDLYKLLNGNNPPFDLSSAEKNAIAESTRETHPLVVGNVAGNVSDYVQELFVNYTPLTGEKFFLLDAEDVSNTAYGYSITSNKTGTRIKKKSDEPDSIEMGWWLRSPNNSDAERAGFVQNLIGQIGDYPVDIGNLGVSPAFNVDLSSVLFASQVNDETGTYGREYKLTLKDDNTKLYLGYTTRQDDTITVPYKIVDRDKNDDITANTVSVLITDADGNVKYYAPLEGEFPTDEEGWGKFDLPDNYTEKDKMYLLAEEVNSQYDTDYSSEMVELALPFPRHYKYPDGAYMQAAKDIVDGTVIYYTRFVFVMPKSEIEGKNKAVFTFDYYGRTGAKPTVTKTEYYSGLKAEGDLYTPQSDDSIILAVTASSSRKLENFTCDLTLEPKN